MSALPRITTSPSHSNSPSPVASPVRSLRSPTRRSPYTRTGELHSLPSPHLRDPAHDSSPSLRHPLTRPLSPDLPTRDALYLFANFSSYMRSPEEGAEGIKNSGDFQDTIRLLDYARTLAAQPYANVHILHVKYRFHLPNSDRAGTYTRFANRDNPLPQGYMSTGRLRGTVPQPFSVLHDPVVKIDFKENGVFDPLPAQAVFSHIAKACQPPPRIIVVSYVQSQVTENHLASLSTWAMTSSPPIHVFSPLETRLREHRPIRVALHHAIPMSMYAWPEIVPSPLTLSPSVSPATNADPDTDPSGAGISPIREKGKDALISPATPRSYPPDPVATLTVITSDEPANPDAPVDRIPLWALAPGVGVLHGSTSASLGIQLSDFSAINLVDDSEKGTGARSTNASMVAPLTSDMGIRTSPLDPRNLGKATRPPVEPVNRTNNATPEPISRPNSTAPPGNNNTKRGWHDGERMVGVAGRVGNQAQGYGQAPTHLTPPDAHPPSLMGHRTQSWPARASTVPGWRKGRREVMEDALEELGKGLAGEALDDVGQRVEALRLNGAERQEEMGAKGNDDNRSGVALRVLDALGDV